MARKIITYVQKSHVLASTTCLKLHMYCIGRAWLLDRETDNPYALFLNSKSLLLNFHSLV